MSEPWMDAVRQTGDHMPGGFFVYLAEGNEEVLYANDIVLDIFGCETFEEWKTLTGGTFPGMVHPEDRSRMEESINIQVEEDDKQLDYIEYRIIRKDGEIRWVDDYGRRVHTERYGDVFYVMLRDITHLHTTRNENRRRADVIEGLSADYKSIYLVNLDSGSMRPYQMENSYFERIARELYEDDVKHADWRRIPPIYAERYVIKEDRDLFLREVTPQRIGEQLAGTKAYTINYRIREEDESLGYVQMSIVRVSGDTMHQYALMGFRDVTAQIVTAQREVADKLNMEMELQREKHANEIKSSFLFNISHDIRTPMNAIKGFTDLALMHVNEPEKLKDYLEKVDESNRHMLALIDDLLEMSRLDYGKIEIKEESCNIKETMHTAVDMLRAKAEEKGLTLEEKVELSDHKVYLDAVRFQRIIGNLLENAVTFTPEGGKVTVSAVQRQTSASGYVRYEFSVADTGIGMSEDFMQRMYEAFERETSSTQSGTIGTGLGLAITKRMLDMMGGTISVKSKKGEGSTFTVGLPLKLVDETTVKDKETKPKDDTHKASGAHRILLVEDIEINRLLAENILKDAGFIVESVADGSDAVEAIRRNDIWYYDLILMDIQMPVMNGYEATRTIRAMDREDAAMIPIIALSANARDEDKKESIESGMNSHVAKPFDIAHLIRTINEHIGARGLM